MHPLPDDFMATVDDERAAFEARTAWLRNLLIEDA
jgi:hypothetical protein